MPTSPHGPKPARRSSNTSKSSTTAGDDTRRWGTYPQPSTNGKTLNYLSTFRGELHPSVPQFQKSKGSLIVTAALELSTNQVTHFYSKGKNTSEMLKLIDRLLDQYSDCEKLYLSWDAGSWHDSHALHARVEAVNNGTYRAGKKIPKLEIVPLPSRAQFLNVIESVFSGMARAIIHSSDYQSVAEAMEAIDRYYRERNEHFRLRPKRAGKKIWGKEPAPSEFSESNNYKDPRWCRER